MHTENDIDEKIELAVKFDIANNNFIHFGGRDRQYQNWLANFGWQLANADSRQLITRWTAYKP